MTDSTYTHLAIVADRSGSMHSIANDMNGGIREFVEEQAALPGKLRLNVTIFDNDVVHLHSDVEAKDIEFPIIHPRGSTALLDAVGESITKLGEQLSALKEDDRPGKVIMVIITDGYENASKDWNIESLKKSVTKQQDEFAWEFIFLGANIDAFGVGGSFGFSKGSSFNYAASAEGVNYASSVLRSAVTTSRYGTSEPSEV